MALYTSDILYISTYQNGTSARILELTNDSSQITTDIDGKLNLAENETVSVSTTAQVYEGAKAQSGWTYSSDTESNEDAGYKITKSGEGAFTVTFNNNFNNQDSLELKIIASKKGEDSLEKIYSITKNRSGAPGSSTVVYEIVPSRTVLNVGNSVGTIGNFTFTILKTEGGGPPEVIKTVDTPGAINVSYDVEPVDGAPNNLAYTFDDGIYTVEYDNVYDYKGVVISIQEYGSESVPFVQNGLAGEDAYSISLSESAIYFDKYLDLDVEKIIKVEVLQEQSTLDYEANVQTESRENKYYTLTLSGDNDAFISLNEENGDILIKNPCLKSDNSINPDYLGTGNKVFNETITIMLYDRNNKFINTISKTITVTLEEESIETVFSKKDFVIPYGMDSATNLLFQDTFTVKVSYRGKIIPFTSSSSLSSNGFYFTVRSRVEANIWAVSSPTESGAAQGVVFIPDTAQMPDKILDIADVYAIYSYTDSEGQRQTQEIRIYEQSLSFILQKPSKTNSYCRLNMKTDKKTVEDYRPIDLIQRFDSIATGNFRGQTPTVIAAVNEFDQSLLITNIQPYDTVSSILYSNTSSSALEEDLVFSYYTPQTGGVLYDNPTYTYNIIIEKDGEETTISIDGAEAGEYTELKQGTILKEIKFNWRTADYQDWGTPSQVLIYKPSLLKNTSFWSEEESIPDSKNPYVYSINGIKKVDEKQEVVYDWNSFTAPELYLAYNELGLDFGQYAEYLRLTNFETEDGLIYQDVSTGETDEDGNVIMRQALSINASYINTGVMTVKKNDKVAFQIGWTPEDDPIIDIGGFTVDENSFTSDNEFIQINTSQDEANVSIGLKEYVTEYTTKFSPGEEEESLSAYEYSLSLNINSFKDPTINYWRINTDGNNNITGFTIQGLDNEITNDKILCEYKSSVRIDYPITLCITDEGGNYPATDGAEIKVEINRKKGNAEAEVEFFDIDEKIILNEGDILISFGLIANGYHDSNFEFGIKMTSKYYPITAAFGSYFYIIPQEYETVYEIRTNQAKPYYRDGESIYPFYFNQLYKFDENNNIYKLVAFINENDNFEQQPPESLDSNFQFYVEVIGKLKGEEFPKYSTEVLKNKIVTEELQITEKKPSYISQLWSDNIAAQEEITIGKTCKLKEYVSGTEGTQLYFRLFPNFYSSQSVNHSPYIIVEYLDTANASAPSETGVPIPVSINISFTYVNKNTQASQVRTTKLIFKQGESQKRFDLSETEKIFGYIQSASFLIYPNEKEEMKVENGILKKDVIVSEVGATTGLYIEGTALKIGDTVINEGELKSILEFIEERKKKTLKIGDTVINEAQLQSLLNLIN